MAKVIVSDLKSKEAVRPGKGRVAEKRVPNGEGQVKVLRTLDVGSSTFGDDLHYVFRKNVAKARRDNKRIIGSADGVVTKR